MREISLAEFVKELQKSTNPQGMKERMQQVKTATKAGCLRSVPMLVERSPVDTGLYAQSWDVREDETSVSIGNFAPHSPIIEYGTRPFTPPIKPLLAWAKRVLKDGSQPEDYSEAVRNLAYGVRGKIQKEGMKPKKIFDQAMPSILKNVREEIGKLK